MQVLLKNMSNGSNRSSLHEHYEEVEVLEKKGETLGSDAYIKQHELTEEEHHESIKNANILTGPQLYLCMFSGLLCLFLVALDQTITVTILTTVANKFDAFSEVTWITTAFVLPLGCLAQFWGKFSVIFGRKFTMLISVFLFEIGSLICALANTMNTLIGGRTLQGIGGGGVISCIFIIVSEITSDDKKPLLLALNGATYGIASVLGPIVGGLLTKASWRWCFWINLCFAAVVFPCFYFSYNSDWKGDKSFKNIYSKLKEIDYVGTVTMVASLVLLLLGISIGTSYRWGSVANITCFVLGGVIFIFFMYWNWFLSKAPVLPPLILKVGKMNINAAISFLANGLFLSTLQFMSLYYQIIYDEKPLDSGVSMLSNIILTSVGTLVVGYSMNRTRRVKEFVFISGFISALGIGIYQVVKVNSRKALFIGLQTICGLGFGFGFHPPLVSAQLVAPKPSVTDKGMDMKSSVMLSTSYITFSKNIGSAFLSEISQLIYTTTLSKNLRKVALDENIPNSEILILVKNVDYMSTLIEKHGYEAGISIKKAFLQAIQNVFWLTFACSLLMTTLGCLMSNKRLPKPQSKEVGKGEKDASLSMTEDT